MANFKQLAKDILNKSIA